MTVVTKSCGGNRPLSKIRNYCVFSDLAEKNIDELVVQVDVCASTWHVVRQRIMPTPTNSCLIPIS